MKCPHCGKLSAERKCSPHNRRVAALILRRNGLSYQAIGEVIGCGKERARQLVALAEHNEKKQIGGYDGYDTLIVHPGDVFRTP
jgi:hypothetical protein